MTNASSPSSLPQPGPSEFRAWLKPFGWGESQIDFLAGDCSFRTYYRLTQENASRILMVAPQGVEKLKEFVDISKVLTQLGFSAPEIYEADMAQGYILHEDFGDQVYSRCLKDGHDEQELYRISTDVLIHLHQQDTSQAPIPPYDLKEFYREAQIFLDWAYPHFTGEEATSALREDFYQLWANIYTDLPKTPQCMVHRDFMVDNLILLPHRDRLHSCGLLDFQDAVRGNVSYDLVSLLEDARRDVPPAIAQEMLERYFNAFPTLDRDDFFHNYYAWGAQRCTKIIGIFLRKALRDTNTQYLDFIPRVWQILDADLQHPALSSVKNWFNTHVPHRKVTLCS